MKPRKNLKPKPQVDYINEAIADLWKANLRERAFMSCLRNAPPFTRERILWLMMK